MIAFITITNPTSPLKEHRSNQMPNIWPTQDEYHHWQQQRAERARHRIDTDYQEHDEVLDVVVERVLEELVR